LSGLQACIIEQETKLVGQASKIKTLLEALEKVSSIATLAKQANSQ